MKSKLKIFLSLVLLPGFIFIYFLDRLYMVPLFWMTALSIKQWNKSKNEIFLSLIRTTVISIFNLIIYLIFF